MKKRDHSLRKNPNYKTGTTYHKGYKYILMPEHPNAVNGYVAEHRLVYEQKLGRYLKSNEIIHHIDRNKLNNDISNLRMFTRRRHAEEHLR